MKQPTIGEALAAQNQGVIPTRGRYEKNHPTLQSAAVPATLPARQIARAGAPLDQYIRALNGK